MTRRQLLFALAAADGGRDAMRIVPPSDRFTVRAEPGFYMHSAGVESFGDELVCTYRRSDEHIASEAEIWCARSKDGGRTWTDHKRISRLGWEPDRASWVAPQLSRTRDGRLLLLTDRGEKISKFDWPMLAQWQLPPRGMSNWLFESRDRGRTWEGPRKIDDVGGEPGYILEMSNGTLVYTRTESQKTNAKKNPSMPWGPAYYRNLAVFSDDRGKTWKRTSIITDDPLVGDCETGLVEHAPGNVLAMTRIGDAGSRYGQPSRLVFSSDFGRTWAKPRLAPVYAHRPALHKLQSDKLFVSFRNAWGTPGTCGLAFDAGETFSYQPNSFIWDESRCRLTRDAMEIRSGNGREGAVEFGFYPVEDDDSVVEFECEMMLREAGANGCNIGAGAWIRFLPHRLELADRPEDGFAFDTTKWHRYRIVNGDTRLRIYADGELKLDRPNAGVFDRYVRLGNRSGLRAPDAKPRDNTRQPLRGTVYEDNASHSLWRSAAVKVMNRRDHSIDWKWTPRAGYPDQFRRDRVIRLEPNASFAHGDSGYSDWAQLPDGTVVVVDYTAGDPPAQHPVLRAYRLRL